MEPIATQTYIKTIREINSIEMSFIEEERTMALYETKLDTAHRTFSTDDIFDLSFRKTGKEKEGILYIHSSKGVFSYSVREDPALFMEKFAEVEKRRLKEQAKKYDRK